MPKQLAIGTSESTSMLAAIQRNNDTGLPQEVLSSFVVTSYRHASTILRHDFPLEYRELTDVMSRFTLPYTQIIVGGGGKGPIAVGFDDQLKIYGWKEKQIPVEITIDHTTYTSPGHKIALYKHRIAVEMEWNNKTEFYDRDLDNFRKLHGLGAISVGIIVTRATELNQTFAEVDAVVKDCNYRYYTKTEKKPRNVKKVSSKYGQSTTHADKLYSKIDGGGGGQCPILVCAIKPGPCVGIDDYTPLILRAKSVGKDFVEAADLPSSSLDKLADEEEADSEQSEDF